MHASAPESIAGAQWFLCKFCNANHMRVGARLTHAQLLADGSVAQELYTADGTRVSLYKPAALPVYSTQDFSTQCYERDMAEFVSKVRLLGHLLCLRKFQLQLVCLPQGSDCTRWVVAGLRPGPVYWLAPGVVFSDKSQVSFAGVHDMKERVYFEPGKAALAILTDPSTVQTDMELTCTDSTTIDSLKMTLAQIGLVRIVTREESGTYCYRGVWMVTSITPSAQEAKISMLDMTRACAFP